MATYDYENQRWITGPEAQRLCKRQLLDELELLLSPEGAKYARFINVDRAEAIKRITLTLTGGMENAHTAVGHAGPGKPCSSPACAASPGRLCLRIPTREYRS